MKNCVKDKTSDITVELKLSQVTEKESATCWIVNLSFKLLFKKKYQTFAGTSLLDQSIFCFSVSYIIVNDKLCDLDGWSI